MKGSYSLSRKTTTSCTWYLVWHPEPSLNIILFKMAGGGGAKHRSHSFFFLITDAEFHVAERKNMQAFYKHDNDGINKSCSQTKLGSTQSYL